MRLIIIMGQYFMIKMKRLSLYIAILSTLGSATSSMAQELDTDKTKKKSDLQESMEVISVTARRQEENIKTTPIAVSAFTGDGLEARGFQDVSDVAKVTPNVVFDGAAPVSGNSAAPSVFIRGVGQLDFTINSDPGVGIYVDGVYMARSVGGIIDLLDLERVEVLRGPQGTLFGRNTIGGAIQLISKKPALDETEGFAKATYGSDNRREVQGSFNLPIGNNSAAKLTGIVKKRDGYVENALGQDLGDDNTFSLRGQYRWQPSDNWETNLSLDYTKDDENGAANVAVTGYPNGAMPYRFNTGSNFGCGAPDAGLTFLGNGDLDTSTAGYSDYISHVDSNPDSCFGLNSLSTSKDKTNSTTPSVSINEIFGSSLSIEYLLGDISFKSITAYRELESKFQRDSDHSQFHIFDTINYQDQDQFSQEFNVSGNQEKLKWLAGYYYFSESATEDVNVVLPAGSRTILIRGFFDNEVGNDNWALFGEATYDLTERLHLTAGLRYTEEEKTYKTKQIFGFNGDGPSPAYMPTGYDLVTVDEYLDAGLPALVTLVEDDAKTDISDTAVRLTAAYDVNDGIFTYATFSQGFKSGGFNPRYLAPTGLGNEDAADDLKAISYEPEYVDMIEIGAKFTFDYGVSLNVAAFMMDYEDMQVSASTANSSGARVTTNAASASIDGLEAEFSWYITDDLVLEGSGGYLDAKYDNLDDSVSFACLPDCNLARIPDTTASLNMVYYSELANGATLMSRLDWSYKSSVEGDANNAAEVVHPSQKLVNASITYTSKNDNWIITGGATNLFDAQYITSSNNNPRLSYSEVIYGRGTEAYISAKRRF
jgi:iron complex outermembrane receptor protein